MPSFSYIAINEQGREVKGVLEAADPDAAVKSLEGQDLMPLRASHPPDIRRRLAHAGESDYRGALLRAAEEIEHGKGIAAALAETGIFPPLVVRMISVGEDSGAIDDMLANISEFYDEEVRTTVDGMTGLIEPILTLGMAVMVLAFALAIFLPMWDMTQMTQQGLQQGY